MVDESNASPRKRKAITRKSNGSGYVFRRGSSWFVRYRDFRMVDGEVRREQVCHKIADVEPGYRSKKPPADVLDLAAEHLSPIKASTDKPQCTQTVVEFADKSFFPYIQKQVRASTYYGYEARWRQLKPWCGQLRLRDTATVDVQQVLDRLASGAKLSSSSIRSLRNLLSGIFGYAIRAGVMPKGFANPVREIKLPKSSKPKKDTYAYPLEELQTMLAVFPEPARTIAAVAGYAGLRRSELKGLDWRDYQVIELDDGTEGPALHVVRSVWKSIEDETKTIASKAWVPVVTPLARFLDAHKLRSGNKSSGPIFRTGSGTWLDMNNVLNRQMLPTLRRCGICEKPKEEHRSADHKYNPDESMPKWHGWHAFRRGLATTLHRIGTPDKVIQQILRHSNVGVTQACYIKTVTADSAAAMRQFEEHLSETIQ